MSDSMIITAISPINIGIIKYFDDPNVKSYYPINDYLTATLDPSVVCAKTSVCARKEFTEDEFWLNGKRDAKQLAFCLNEVKYRAATQRTVSVEFLTRKVHIACENNFLPATGASSFAAGFISIMSALCRLYKIKANSVTNQSVFPDIATSHRGGFVLRRELYVKKNFKGKLIAEGKHWPELRVLLLVVKSPRNQISTERIRGVVRTSQYMNYRLNESLPLNLKLISKAIKQRDFTTFAETMMKDNNQYHSVNTDTYPPRAYKTEISHRIVEVIHIYNKIVHQVRAAYLFDTGPNAALFFLKKHAQEVISLIRFIFPSSKPDFIRGMEAPCDVPNVREHFRSFPIGPMKLDRIKFAVYTQVGNVSVQIDKENHLLDDNGNLKYTVCVASSPTTSSSSDNYSDALTGSLEDLRF